MLKPTLSANKITRKTAILIHHMPPDLSLPIEVDDRVDDKALNGKRHIFLMPA
jgi:hypothetical protein